MLVVVIFVSRSKNAVVVFKMQSFKKKKIEPQKCNEKLKDLEMLFEFLKNNYNNSTFVSRVYLFFAVHASFLSWSVKALVSHLIKSVFSSVKVTTEIGDMYSTAAGTAGIGLGLYDHHSKYIYRQPSNSLKLAVKRLKCLLSRTIKVSNNQVLNP